MVASNGSGACSLNPDEPDLSSTPKELACAVRSLDIPLIGSKARSFPTRWACAQELTPSERPFSILYHS